MQQLRLGDRVEHETMGRGMVAGMGGGVVAVRFDDTRPNVTQVVGSTLRVTGREVHIDAATVEQILDHGLDATDLIRREVERLR